MDRYKRKFKEASSVKDFIRIFESFGFKARSVKKLPGEEVEFEEDIVDRFILSNENTDDIAIYRDKDKDVIYADDPYFGSTVLMKDDRVKKYIMKYLAKYIK